MGNIRETRYDAASRVTDEIAPHPTLTIGLLNFWSFLEDNGPTTAHLSGNGHTGTLVGPANEVSGRLGGAIQFDGVDDYIALGNPADLNVTGEITISAWIKPAATDGIRNMVAHGHSPSPQGEVYLRINNGEYQVGS